jgi:hypothetical protein
VPLAALLLAAAVPLNLLSQQQANDLVTSITDAMPDYFYSVTHIICFSSLIGTGLLNSSSLLRVFPPSQLSFQL